MSLIADRANDILVDEQIGRTQALTPEGFLLCSGVRIARTGPMIYAPGEIPDIEPAPSRTMITVDRSADVLFDPDAIASFAGKPVTNDHPDEFVSPENWRSTAIGVVLNPRRGEGVETEYLLADLLITDAAAIADVRSGKREVSCGYDSERETVKPGYGRQTKIVGNHVALVDRGRCGPSCAIQDQHPVSAAYGKEPAMALKKRSVWDRMRTAFKAQDEAAFEEELEKAQDETGDEPQKVVIELKQPEAAPAEPEQTDQDDPIAKLTEVVTGLAGKFDGFEARLAKIEGGNTADEDPEEESEEPKKEGTTDSASLRDEFADTIARAEILSPGIKLPTFDAKANRKLTVDAICALRTKALKNAFGDEGRKAHVVAVLGDRPDFGKLTCDAAGIAFRAASELARAANNSATRSRPADIPQGPMTAAAYQQLIEQRRKRA